MSKTVNICDVCGEKRVINSHERAKKIDYCLGCMMRIGQKVPIRKFLLSEADYKNLIKEERMEILRQTNIINIEKKKEEKEKKTIADYKLLNQ